MPSVVLIGQSRRTEFGPVLAGLAAHSIHVIKSDPSPQFANGAPSADLWIVCQSWPDEFSPSEVCRIVDGCASKRLMCVYGAWCASDGRTRDTWPLASRVPVCEFAARLRSELGMIAGRTAPVPMTAARDECFAARVQPL
jgi:hypothetical protein